MTTAVEPLLKGKALYRRLSDEDRRRLAFFALLETCPSLVSRWGKEEVVLTEKEGCLVHDRAALERLILP